MPRKNDRHPAGRGEDASGDLERPDVRTGADRRSRSNLPPARESCREPKRLRRYRPRAARWARRR